MDPDAALRELRGFFENIEGYEEDVPVSTLMDYAGEFLGLDDWLTHGGKLPKDWQREDGNDG